MELCRVKGQRYIHVTTIGPERNRKAIGQGGGELSAEKGREKQLREGGERESERRGKDGECTEKEGD